MNNQRFSILRPLLEKTRRCFLCRSRKALIHREQYSVCLFCCVRTRFINPLAIGFLRKAVKV